MKKRRQPQSVGSNQNNQTRPPALLLAPAMLLLLMVGFAQKARTTVTIGKQTWMVKNLDVDTFRNGDPIPQAKTDAEWKKASQDHAPAWCYLDNIPTNGKIYGKLYNWFAVTDSRGLAPKGYKVPTKDDWHELMEFAGGQQVAGKKLKSQTGWPDNGNGSNESGFTGLPGGIRYHSGHFDTFRKYGHWWTSTNLPPIWAWQYYMTSRGDEIGYYSKDFGKGAGLSVRCLKE